MKILSAALIALIVFAVIFWGLFYYSVRVARETTATFRRASTASSSSAGSLSKINSPTTTPTNSRGPTSGPYMHGPSGPPPNY